MNKKPSLRQERVADEIQKELAIIINNKLSDPRLGLITISEVVLNRDLSIAKVYVTIMPDEKREETLEALYTAVTFLRSQLAAKIKLRYMPKLRFLFDSAQETGQNMEKLLASLKKD